MPLNDETHNLIDKKAFICMKNSAILINISRGNIINEGDLIYALKNNLIHFAALDVLKTEPLSRWSRLWKLKNLLITPHIAGNINLISGKIQKDFLKKLKLNA